MPSKVWCGRAPYVVRNDRSEIQALMVEHDIIWLDLLAAGPSLVPDSGQVMLASAHISAVEHSPTSGRDTQQSKTCSCGPGSGCSDCPPVASASSGAAASNVRFHWRSH